MTKSGETPKGLRFWSLGSSGEMSFRDDQRNAPVLGKLLNGKVNSFVGYAWIELPHCRTEKMGLIPFFSPKIQDPILEFTLSAAKSQQQT